MTRELAERILVALAPLREGAPGELAREAFALANAFDAEAIRPAREPVKWSLYGGTITVDMHHDGSVSRWLESIGCERSVGTVFGQPAPSPSLADGEWRDAAKPAAPTDPRRTVGAVVRWIGMQFIVVAPGEEGPVMRDLEQPDDELCPTSLSDTFVRWATREECERHGIAYVKRGPKGGPSLEQGTPLPVDDGAAPSPAASPAPYVPTPAKAGAAAYVPQVGDVVQINAYPSIVYTGYDKNRSPFPHRGLRVDGVRDGWADGSRISYQRPATAAERAAAGLDAPASKPVDREGLRKALFDEFESWRRNITSDGRKAPEVACDAVFSYLDKNGGAS